jgi:hypothetical protein
MPLLAMSSDESIGWFFGGLIALAFSCVIASSASGDRASMAWGLLGPVGWVVAALRGAHVRLEEIRDRLSAPPPPAATSDGPIRRVSGPADSEGRVNVVCGGCNEGQRLFPAPDLATECRWCGKSLPGFRHERPS